SALSKHIIDIVDANDKIAEKPGSHPMRNLYYLWTVERVGVLYQQKDIAGQDWYRWGARYLLATQQPGGNWTDGHYLEHRDLVDTCFALLFLKRVNLVKDLTNKLPLFHLD